MIKSLQPMLIYNIFIHCHVFVLWLQRQFFFARAGRGGGGKLKQSFLDSFSLLRLTKLKGGFPLSRDFYIRTHRH